MEKINRGGKKLELKTFTGSTGYRAEKKSDIKNKLIELDKRLIAGRDID